MTTVTPEQMRAAREPTPAADPTLNPKYPHSGLTVEETDLLEREGWHETGFESLPPPWARVDGDGALYAPREALGYAHKRVAGRLLGAEMASLCAFLGRPAIKTIEGHEQEVSAVLFTFEALWRRFDPAYLTGLADTLSAFVEEDYARACAALDAVLFAPKAEKPAPSPVPAFDLDAVLREISTKGVEIRFRAPDGDVSVCLIDAGVAMAGKGATVEAAVLDLAGQCLAFREKERDALFARFDAAEKRRAALATFLCDPAETPSQ